MMKVPSWLYLINDWRSHSSTPKNNAYLSITSEQKMEIKSQEELRALYGWPKGRAVDKVLSKLEVHAKHFIAKSPFLVLSTYDKLGKADTSPKGGQPGFVHVLDDETILIPDSKGNNRLDGLVNIIETGNVGCLFMIPGIEETLRINGIAIISTNPSHINLFAEDQNPPVTCLKISIKEVFLHCAKALLRSDLWGDTNRLSRPGFPTMGQMLKDQLKTDGPLETQAEMLKRYQKDL